MKKYLITLSLLLGILSLTGCKNRVQEVKIDNKNNDKTIVAEKTQNTEVVENVKDHSSGKTQRLDISSYNTDSKDAQVFINNSKKIMLNVNGENTNMTFKEIADLLNTKVLKKKYKDYKIQENLVYNYIETTNKTNKGISLTDVLEETRQNDQYYKDDSRTTGNNTFLRQILGIKYKNKSNQELYIGEFLTREKDKPVELEWREETNEDRLKYLQEVKNIDFSGITDFYEDEFNGLDDFKAKGRMSLKQWKDSILITVNAGTQTLKNMEAVITREIIDKGVTKEEELTIRTLEDNKFDYDLTVKDNVITMEIDLTNCLNDYYKLFEQYDIKNAKYKIVVTELTVEEDVSINEEFDKVKTEEANEEETKKPEIKNSKKIKDLNTNELLEWINSDEEKIYLIKSEQLTDLKGLKDAELSTDAIYEGDESKHDTYKEWAKDKNTAEEILEVVKKIYKEEEKELNYATLVKNKDNEDFKDIIICFFSDKIEDSELFDVNDEIEIKESVIKEEKESKNEESNQESKEDNDNESSNDDSDSK